MNIQTDLKVNIELDGIHHVEVIQPIGNDTLRLIWTFSLKGHEEPIYFKEFYTDTQFVIVDWNGWVSAYDVERRERVFETDLGGHTFTQAVFSPDKSKLHVAYARRKDRTPLLATFSLPDFTLTASQELPDKAFTRHLQVRGDGCLLGYYHEECEEEVPTRNQWIHGYYVFDPATSRVERHAMEHAQRDALIEQAPVISATRNLGVMPYWGDVDVQWDDKGEPLFPYKMVVSDLTNFNVLRILTVCRYTQSQLGKPSLSGEEMAKRLMERKPGREYEKALSDFYGDAHWCANDLEESDDGVWLDSRHGRIVNLINDSVPDREYTPLPMKQWRPSPKKWEITPEAAQQLAERDKVVILVDDLTQAEGFLQALDQRIELTEDIAAIGCGGKLAFLVKDKGGLTMEDRDFFHKALPHADASEKIKKVVDNFIKYDEADRLYIDCEETALCYAVYELAKSSPRYIETTLRYLSVIDEGHDVFNTETLIPMLMDVYGSTEHEETIRRGVLGIAVEAGFWEDALRAGRDAERPNP